MYYKLNKPFPNNDSKNLKYSRKTFACNSKQTIKMPYNLKYQVI